VSHTLAFSFKSRAPVVNQEPRRPSLLRSCRCLPPRAQRCGAGPVAALSLPPRPHSRPSSCAQSRVEQVATLLSTEPPPAAAGLASVTERFWTLESVTRRLYAEVPESLIPAAMANTAQASRLPRHRPVNATPATPLPYRLLWQEWRRQIAATSSGVRLNAGSKRARVATDSQKGGDVSTLPPCVFSDATSDWLLHK